MVCVISVRLIFVERNDDGLLTANGLENSDSAQTRKRTGSHRCTVYMAWDWILATYLNGYVELVFVGCENMVQRV